MFLDEAHEIEIFLSSDLIFHYTTESALKNLGKNCWEVIKEGI